MDNKYTPYKGQGTGSNIRRREVFSFQNTDQMQELKQLLGLPPENIRVRFHRMYQPPPGYEEKVDAGILPAWLGTGTLLQLVCYPSNRSNNVRANWKWPSLYILDSNAINPLNCSDVFKTIGAIYCVNCPSVNGSLGGCCHIGFMFLFLSAHWALESTNRVVRLVNMKNPEYLHPHEVMSGTITNKGFTTYAARNSNNKRTNSSLLFPEDLFEPDDADDQVNYVKIKRKISVS